MQEWKRIFLDRRFLAVFLILLVVNGVYCLRATQTEELVEQSYQELVKLYQGKVLEEICMEKEELSRKSEEEFQKQAEQGIFEQEELTEEEAAYGAAKSEILAQAEYLLNYQERIGGIESSAAQLRKNPALGAEGSFSVRNIDKTVRDYKRIEGVSVSLDNEHGVNAYLECRLSGFLLCVQLLVVVMIFQDERKKGLWNYVYALPGGRRKLALQRGMVLASAAWLCGLLFEAENLLISGVRGGGFGVLSRAVQSNQAFGSCVLPVSMGGFLVLVACTRILAAWLAGELLWCVAGISKHPLKLFFFTAVFLAGEYFVWVNTGEQSFFNQVKYVNIFAFFDSGEMLAVYRNLSFFGHPMSCVELQLFGVPAVLLLLFFMGILTGEKRPCTAGKGRGRTGRISRHGSLFLHECYKVLVNQKAVFVLIAMAVVCLSFFEGKKEIFRDYASTLYESYMEMLEGDVTEEKLEFLEQERNGWEKKAEESAEKIAEYESEPEKYRELEKEQKNYEKLQTALEVTGFLQNEGERLEKLKEKGETAGFVNQTGYQRYLGKGGWEQAGREAMLILVLLVAACSGIQSYEKGQNAQMFLRSTPGGRKRLDHVKTGLVLLLAAVISLAVTVSGYFAQQQNYPMAQQQMSWRSLPMFADRKVVLPLACVTAGVWVGRCLVAMAVALVIKWISGKAGNVMTGLLLNCIVLVAPAGLAWMGFSVFEYLSFFRILMVTGWYS